MKKLALVYCAILFLSACSGQPIRNNPDTIIDDILVPLTLGLYRG
jgi:hypothetical protein